MTTWVRLGYRLGMRQRVGLILVLGFIGVALGFGQARADDPPPAEQQGGTAAAEEHHEATPAEHHEGSAEEHHEATPGEHHEADEHHEGEHHEAEHHEAEAEHHEAEHHESGDAAADADEDDDAGDVPYTKFDADGDGKEDPALKAEYEAAIGGISADIDTEAVDKLLEARPEDAEMKPSISVEQFQKIVLVVKKVVLDRMEKKMAKGTAKKMKQFSIGIFVFSLLGLLLLAIPLAVGKNYPGKFGILFKYSALAAVTFFVTVNLFGGVLMGMRTAQGALGSMTNPSLAIAGGTFDTLHDHAEDYI
ncbi:MAG: hypothetical protein JWO36_1925, partial [Myxococcales bacterium]|nr:hypothetical protein [Myxococcales bacterium]